MVISPNKSDTNCILGNSDFFERLQNISLWTIEDKKLYLLSEKWEDSQTMESVIILQPEQPS